MEFIRGLRNLRKSQFGNVLTIGNFDGVHRGHQAIIAQLKQRAAEMGVPSLIMSFEPHPEEYFSRVSYGTRLTPLREKLDLLSHFAIDRVLCVQFNQAFADMSAENFVTQVLHQQLGAKHIVIGDDFCFGRGRQGSFDLLQSMGKELGFTVEHTHTLTLDEERISSTRIREALRLAKLDLAEQLLGHPYYIYGVVQHGDKRGRTIGFPTANIRVKQQIAPPNGVYAVKISGLERDYDGVANIGMRPTVGGTKYQLEVHIFDFNQDIYRRKLRIHLSHFIRPEMKFSGLDELTAQIKQDCEHARSLIQND